MIDQFYSEEKLVTACGGIIQDLTSILRRFTRGNEYTFATKRA